MYKKITLSVLVLGLHMVATSAVLAHDKDESCVKGLSGIYLAMDDWVYTGMDCTIETKKQAGTAEIGLQIPTSNGFNHVNFSGCPLVEPVKLKAKGFAREYGGWVFHIEYPNLPASFPTCVFVSDEQSDVAAKVYPVAFYFPNRGWIASDRGAYRGKPVFLGSQPTPASEETTPITQ